MTATLLINASVLDVERGALIPDQAVLIDGERIIEVGPVHVVRSTDPRTLDLRGKTLLPGLIDCHVHVTAATADLSELAEWSPTYVAAHAQSILRGMLERGFTT
ncbi:MAG TPA: amidohydrolase family protein, partial [Chloroflexota bacterium]|nr:amidohydrolase family protein [Chloroflexota bacterium]